MIRRVTNILTSVFLILGIVLFILLVGVKVIGITPYAVTSGSMIPEYPVGSVVYVKPVEARELQAGDDITFYMAGNSIATHRVKENDTQRQEIQTYGINNKDSEGNVIEDAEKVKYENVIGRVHYAIPYIGWISLRTTKGKMILIGIAVLLLLIPNVLMKFYIGEGINNEEK